MVAGGNVTTVCEHCGKSFLSWKSNQRRYCSKDCSKQHHSKNCTRHGECGTRLYQAWTDMKHRCYTESGAYFEYYGGRGISVCDEWRNNYVAFRDWALANGYADDLELDRRDPNGNYEPNNCRWATRKQQMRNTRKRRDGKTSKFKGVSWCRLAQKWKAQITEDGTNKYLGLFSSEEGAARAYDDAAVRLSGEFAYLNFPRCSEVGSRQECVPS